MEVLEERSGATDIFSVSLYTAKFVVYRRLCASQQRAPIFLKKVTIESKHFLFCKAELEVNKHGPLLFFPCSEWCIILASPGLLKHIALSLIEGKTVSSYHSLTPTLHPDMISNHQELWPRVLGNLNPAAGILTANFFPKHPRAPEAGSSHRGKHDLL